MPSWTNDQQKAITTRGGKIIVSAAAGSGKTAVLSQRVIEYVLSGGNIDELLIVTFTNAAALEMKIRIKDKISEELEKDKNNTHLKKQLSLVESAKITTMDAYYKYLVEENFDKLGIDKSFDILSNEEEKILKDKVLTNILEDAFISIKDYDKALDMFGLSSSDLIKEVTLKVSNFLDTVCFPKCFIKEALEKYQKGNSFYKDLLLKEVKDKINSFISIYDELIEELYKDIALEKVYITALKEKEFLLKFNDIKTIDELSSLIRSITFDTLRTPKGYAEDENVIRYKTIRDDLKSIFKKDYSELKFINEKTYNEEKEKCLEALTVLFEIVLLFKERLLIEKKKINSYSFSDIAHFVIELLIKDGKKTSLAIEESKKYNEILIDEYQDTNNLQNIIFSSISKDNSNLFIVGDVKQSIYRFRSACPEIFNNDKNNSTKDGFPRLITLSKNFRSRKEVLDFCNFIFSNTMTSYFGEVNYDEDEMLYLGASFEEGKNLDTNVYIIDGNKKYLEEENELSNAQKEAVFVADKIKELIESKYQVFDNKKGLWRDIKASDIVILLRSLKNSEFYLEALNKRKISVYSEVSHEYFDNYEISLVINILKLIDNLYDDVALMSLLNSDLTDISLDYISCLRSNDKSIFLYENLLKSNDEAIINLLNTLNELNNKSKTLSIFETLNEVYKTFDIVKIIKGLKGGNQRSKNLMHMLTYASNFEGSIHEFISYIENIILSKGTLEGINPLSEGDNVLITTIHKSKGLEYPIVFLCETGKNFNFSDVRSNFMISDDLKVTFNIKDTLYKLKYESIPMLVSKTHEINKMLSEELRILYVALTRAKEKLIITGYVSNLENKIIKASSKIGNESVVSKLYLWAVKNYMDIIIPSLLRHDNCKVLKDYTNVSVKTFKTDALVTLDVILAGTINEDEFNEKKRVTKEIFDEKHLEDILRFNYDDSLCNLPINISVSDLKAKENYLRKPNFLKDGINHASIGTLYHKIFEKLPVKKYSINELEYELDLLVKNKIISREERKLLDISKVFSYLTSDIYDMILTSDNVYREKKISFKLSSSYYLEETNSGDILVDGIIDLLFVKEDTYFIVDYKTDNITDINELVDLYRVQLDLYEYALKSKGIKNIRKFIYSIKLNKYIEV